MSIYTSLNLHQNLNISNFKLIPIHISLTGIIALSFLIK